MKKLTGLIVLLLSASLIYAQKSNPDYDAELAQKLGADDYGMKSYVLVILKTGKNTSKDTAETRKAFSGHMENINRLVKEEKLIVAGPLQKNELNYRGIFILNVKDIEEAKKLVQTDPAVVAGFLDAEYLGWYGSAALPTYLPYSDKIWKTGF